MICNDTTRHISHIFSEVNTLPNRQDQSFIIPKSKLIYAFFFLFFFFFFFGGGGDVSIQTVMMHTYNCPLHKMKFISILINKNTGIHVLWPRNIPLFKRKQDFRQCQTVEFKNSIPIWNFACCMMGCLKSYTGKFARCFVGVFGICGCLAVISFFIPFSPFQHSSFLSPIYLDITRS